MQAVEKKYTDDMFVAAVNETEYLCGTIACPARFAGYHPGDDASTGIAHEYDRVLHDWVEAGKVEVTRHQGIEKIIVPEDVAREAWLKAIRGVKSGDQQQYTLSSRNTSWSQVAAVGEEIARELDWLDEGEEVGVEA